MKTLILRRLALGLLPALLAWPTTALWADIICTGPNDTFCSNDAVPEITPTSDFILNDDGTAYHKKTGLTWKRCAEGQTWYWDSGAQAGSCTETEDYYDWSGTLSRATTDGWRLPNLKELQSIVEKRNWNPAINATVFPNTPATIFWSASPVSPDAYRAWLVSFFSANDVALFKVNVHAVRLVRGGQYSLLSVTKAGTGSGTVTSDLPGIDCGPYCKGSFANEMFATAGEIILTAIPIDANSVFDGWEGCTPLVEGNKCTFALSTAADTSVTANFSPKNVTPTLSINDVSERERNHGDKTPFIFKVTLSSASTHPVTVYYVTANGTAKAGSDYTWTIGMLWFARGQTTRVVKVDVSPDTKREGDETFFVNLRWARGATILDGQGLGTILNDD